MNVTIFGSGAWGTALAIHLCKLNHTVTLVPRRLELAMELNDARENRDYLPGFGFDPNLQIGFEIAPAIMEADVIILACPSQGLRPLVNDIKKHLPAAENLQAIISLSKGLDVDSLQLPVDILKAVIPNIPFGVLSGPNFASEIAEALPAASVLAIHADSALTESIQNSFSNKNFRVYLSTDVTGVELGGCLKNVYAIGAGICDGLKLGYNTKAAYLTRALHELVKLGTQLGGDKDTFYGLSGFGDLIATCTAPKSRNRSFGQNIAEGKSTNDLLANRKTVVEGMNATDCFFRLAQKNHVETPILNELYEVLYHQKSPSKALYTLMTRELKAETL
ncbi:MAG: glycerol-3-phosphate dehydrogenase [Verrucomicrobia bacterium CG_4_10_14_3_um_filter_43_23]|nr:MAG: glycerol-3-phosphate dehydrogenase [Verrucomicrobia bacterium CG1_02_43_26]PIP59374.1 MAG: glycerol-3-phosphate dehydrogenase [Verrucomicrobia bacterium CG22_combo_CG10-13_8_21_14_all_43_17]PIX58022.1 MAG: glycerol-3-phosphate dehydrogenase [Verrucomicrobia bacterium CG_4_10_14_3_um_filter_43_23]PIY62849.1 MAG: glycerol-3-phosphate dehydrogenase [Verrucomicrobia bacterium CG_4_10_14_0_8_um_filter_43_34]PJA44724.1 MAG: glycerol-3-phosphate dehydrogenase [Verrucomicrobia bacterium CG_4_9_